MPALVQFFAVAATTGFAGAAIYINLVEHPARMGCSTELAATVWDPSYKRATLMQVPLAIIGFLGGLVAWALGASFVWLVGALFIIAVIPVTLIIIFPTNKLLLAPGLNRGAPETRDLLVKSGHLHAIRTFLSVVASVIYVWQLVGA